MSTPIANNSFKTRKISLVANTPALAGSNDDGSPMAGRFMWRASYQDEDAIVKIVESTDGDGKTFPPGPDCIRFYGDQIAIYLLSSSNVDVEVEDCK